MYKAKILYANNKRHRETVENYVSEEDTVWCYGGCSLRLVIYAIIANGLGISVEVRFN